MSNFLLLTKCFQHYLYQQISIERHRYTHMLQSVEERLRHCNVLTKHWCLLCTTHNDKVERRKFLAHCKGKWLPWRCNEQEKCFHKCVKINLSMQHMLTCYDQPTVQILEPGHLGEDYPTTMFFENRKFSIFFAYRPITSKYSTIVAVL